ncbi:hypothetical protein IWQ60_000468 [Tieghemiomyces parasiticus]|uniref:R3H-associated N-terminal domain-containing protein n=1 Tax=Tieghemiomyces parasiticus TaxID=78921 RepID=A0A9W8AL17_9FUNG|nr:hypothetical protein IWQ60_000468 [Tieghemiomyces parasiticus]
MYTDYTLATARAATHLPSYPLPPLSPCLAAEETLVTPRISAETLALLKGTASSAKSRETAPVRREFIGRTGRRHIKRQGSAMLIENLANLNLPPDTDEAEFVPDWPRRTFRFDRENIRRALLSDRAARRCDIPVPTSPAAASWTHPQPGSPPHSRETGHIRRRLRCQRISDKLVDRYESELVTALSQWFPATATTSAEDSADEGVAVVDVAPKDAETASPAKSVAPIPLSRTVSGEDWQVVHHSEAERDPTAVRLRQEDEGVEEDLVLVSHDLTLEEQVSGQATPVAVTQSTSGPSPTAVSVPHYLSWETDALSRLVIHCLSEYYHLRSVSLTDAVTGRRTIYVFHPAFFRLSPEGSVVNRLNVKTAEPAFVWPDRTLAHVVFG